jgi:hypothetical protein
MTNNHALRPNLSYHDGLAGNWDGITQRRKADISGARPLLEHALERGSARAAFMLAETYDARVLRSWRTRGISKARELYERAQAGGDRNFEMGIGS